MSTLKSIIALHFFAIIYINAKTSYFVGLYESPFGEKHIPYPLDTCVNTAVGIEGGSYGIYTCNESGDIVTYTHYESDSLCQDETVASITATYDNNNELITGDLFSFECKGDNSYLETESSINDPSCTNPQVTTHFAINVCYRLPSGDSAMISCNETDAIQYTYFQSDGCDVWNKATNPDYQFFSDECVVFETFMFVIDINTIMSSCVVDNSNIAPTVVDIIPAQEERNFIENVVNVVVSFFHGLF
eukprot:516720_1